MSVVDPYGPDWEGDAGMIPDVQVITNESEGQPAPPQQGVTQDPYLKQWVKKVQFGSVLRYENPPFVNSPRDTMTVQTSAAAPSRRVDYESGRYQMTKMHLVKGYMETSQGAPVNPFDATEVEVASKYFRLNFYYNPTEIQTNYEIDSSAIPPDLLTTEAQNTVMAPITGQSMTVSLFFDRTAEVARGEGVNELFQGGTGPFGIPLPSVNDTTRRQAADFTYNQHPGVLVDLFILERLAGLIPGDYQGTSYAGGGAKPFRFFFGGSSSTVFQGYMRAMTARFTIFSNTMIPMMMEVSLSIQRIYSVNNVGGIWSQSPVGVGSSDVSTSSLRTPTPGHVTQV